MSRNGDISDPPDLGPLEQVEPGEPIDLSVAFPTSYLILYDTATNEPLRVRVTDRHADGETRYTGCIVAAHSEYQLMSALERIFGEGQRGWALARYAPSKKRYARRELAEFGPMFVDHTMAPHPTNP